MFHYLLTLPIEYFFRIYRSGKSSMMIALFRIQEMSAGQILVDGIDTATVPLRILRSKLGIIPQDPVIFSASVRFNLDPFDEYTDGMIWDALTSVDMKVRREVLVIIITIADCYYCYYDYYYFYYYHY